MAISNGTVLAGLLAVGNSGPGTLTLAGGSLIVSSNLNIGSSSLSATLWITGGQLTATNNSASDAIRVGYLSGNGGNGVMAVSNGTVLADSIVVGNNTAVGTLTIAGGNVTASNLSLNVNYGHGYVWLTGGQLNLTNGSAMIGVENSSTAYLIVTNGALQALSMIVGQTNGGYGNVRLSGGTVSVFSNLVIGSCAPGAFGTMMISNGANLFVTNASHNACLEVRRGTLSISNGAIVQVDNLVITNSCGGRLLHYGGTLLYGNLVLNPDQSAVGDGIPNSWKQQYGFDPLDPTVASADPDGDGFSNLQEYLAGTDPTNSASSFHIISVVPSGIDLLVTWMMGSGKTNALQATSGDFSGGYNTNDFSDIFTVTNTVGTVTNYLDLGAATNGPTRYYRVRLVP